MKEQAKPSRERFIEMLADGMSVESIADLYSVNRRSAYRWLNSYGLLLINKPSRPQHGTYNMYSKRGCRCGLCREANTANWVRQRSRRSMRGTPSEQEHNASTYNNWGCRCGECIVAWSEYMKEQRNRRKRASA